MTPTIAQAAFKACCPACGKGRLYSGLLTIAERCDACGLPLTHYHQGDGPASLAILLVGGLAAIFASILEVTLEPPYWVHAAIWIPFILIGSVLSLRWLKAALVAVQYRVRPGNGD